MQCNNRAHWFLAGAMVFWAAVLLVKMVWATITGNLATGHWDAEFLYGGMTALILWGIAAAVQSKYRSG
jgi:hypothetical protein